MQLFAKFKKNLRSRFRATLNFRKFKVALNSFRRIFLNFAKSCVLSCQLQFDNKEWGSPSSFLSYKRLKLKLRVFLARHIVAIVTYCAAKLPATCSPMIGQFFDSMTLASTSIEWLFMTHQTPSLKKYWKLFPATLSAFPCDRTHVRRMRSSIVSIMQSVFEFRFMRAIPHSRLNGR